jgi:hypothetical protein
MQSAPERLAAIQPISAGGQVMVCTYTGHAVYAHTPGHSRPRSRLFVARGDRRATIHHHSIFVLSNLPREASAPEKEESDAPVYLYVCPGGPARGQAHRFEAFVAQMATCLKPSYLRRGSSSAVFTNTPEARRLSHFEACGPYCP